MRKKLVVKVKTGGNRGKEWQTDHKIFAIRKRLHTFAGYFIGSYYMNVINKRILMLLVPFLMGISSLAAQSLSISLGSNDPGAETIPRSVQNVTMLQLQLAASDSEDINITSIVITPTYTNVKVSEIDDPEIRIYNDVNNNGVYESSIDLLIAAQNYTAASNQPQPTTVTMSKTIFAGNTENWLILHSFGGGIDNLDPGDMISVAVANNADITATGAISGNLALISGTPVSGGTKTGNNGSTGTLTLSTGSNDPGNRNIAAGAQDEVMFQLLMSVGAAEDINIGSITFSMSGTGNESVDLNSVELWHDTDNNGLINPANDHQIGSTLSSFSDNGNLIFSGISETLAASSFENWLVVYDFNGAVSNGSTFLVDVPNNTSLTAIGTSTISAATINGTFPVSGGTATVSVTGNLTVEAGANNPVANNISAAEQNLVMLQMKLSASATEAIDISSVTFTTSGTAPENTAIDSVMLFNDNNSNGSYDPAFDTQIGSKLTGLTDNGPLLFSGLSEQIIASGNENWIVVYCLNGTANSGSTFRTYLNSNADFTVRGASSTNPISVSGAPVNGNVKTVSSIGGLTIAAGSSNPGSQSISPTAHNVTMLQLNLSANITEDLLINSITVTPSVYNISRNNIDDIEINIYRDVNNNGLYDAATDQFISSVNYNGGASPLPPTATTVTTNQTITAGNSENWLIVNSFGHSPSTAPPAGATIDVDIVQNSDISVTGVTSGQPANVSGATVSGGTKTVANGATPGDLSLFAGTNNPVFRYIENGVTDVMIQLGLSASSVEDIDISAIKFIGNIGTNWTGIDAAALYNDVNSNGLYDPGTDSQIGTTITTFNDDTLRFSSLTETIAASGSENWIIVYTFNNSNSVGSSFIVSMPGNNVLTAAGVTSSSSITPTGAPVIGGEAVITDQGTLTLSAGPANPSDRFIVNNETDVTVVQMNLAAGSNEDIDISALTVTAYGTFDDPNDFTSSSLYWDTNDNGALDGGVDIQLGTSQNWSGDNGTMTFSSLGRTISQGTSQNWMIVSTLAGTAADAEYFRVEVKNATDITAQGANTLQTIFPSGTPVSGGTMTVSAVGNLTASLGTNNPGASSELNSATSLVMLQINLSASPAEDVNISTIVISGDGTANDNTDITGVSLYEDVNGDGILDGGDVLINTGTYTLDDGTITFNMTGRIITQGISENWIVVYDLNGSASDGETFRAGVYSGGITATGVTSLQSLSPIGLPVVGNYKTISGIGSLTIAAGDNDPGVSSVDRAVTQKVMMQFSVSAGSVEDVDFSTVTITHQGSGDPVADIGNNGVLLWQDINNNGQFDPLIDDSLTMGTFSGGTAILSTFYNQVIVTRSTLSNFLILYDFNGNATHNTTFQATIDNALHVTGLGITSSQPVSVSGSFPVSGGLTTVTGFAVISAIASDLNPSGVIPGATDVGMMQVTFNADKNAGQLASIRIDNRSPNATNDAADIDLIKVYKEDGTSIGFQPGEDVLLGSSAVTDDGSGGNATVSLSPALDVSIADASIYVVYDISVTANSTNFVGASILNSGYITPGTPETSMNTNGYPLETQTDASLPVELIFFSAIGGKGSVTLTWETASEIDNLGFIIERRMEEESFRRIAGYTDTPGLEGLVNSATGAVYNYIDESILESGNYLYRLLQVDIDGSIHQVGDVLEVFADDPLPIEFSLGQNYPNPFNPETTIRYELPVNAKVNLYIYNTAGQLVSRLVDGSHESAGKKKILWNGRNDYGQQVSSGVYFYMIQTDGFKAVKKMLLLK